MLNTIHFTVKTVKIHDFGKNCKKLEFNAHIYCFNGKIFFYILKMRFNYFHSVIFSFPTNFLLI